MSSACPSFELPYQNGIQIAERLFGRYKSKVVSPSSQHGVEMHNQVLLFGCLVPEYNLVSLFHKSLHALLRRLYQYVPFVSTYIVAQEVKALGDMRNQRFLLLTVYLQFLCSDYHYK